MFISIYKKLNTGIKQNGFGYLVKVKCTELFYQNKLKNYQLIIIKEAQRQKY